MTNILSTAIPKLLSTYQAESNVQPLVEIPQYLDLESFTSGNAQAFKKMLKALKAVYLKHVDPETFEKVAATFNVITDNTHDLADDAAHFVRELATLMVQRLSEMNMEQESPGDDAAEEIKIAVYRLLALMKNIDCSDLLELDYRKMQKFCLVDSEGDKELGLALLELDYARFLWEVANLKEEEEKDGNLTELNGRVNEVYKIIGHVLSKPDLGVDLKAKVCGVVTPFFILSTKLNIPSPSAGVVELYREAVSEFLERILDSSEDEQDVAMEQLKQVFTLSTAYPDFADIVHTLFRYYMKGSKSLDETIKSIASQMKKSRGSAILAQAQLGALKQVYAEEKSSRTKEVAFKFVLMHGIQSKRNELAAFMREGIDHALAGGADFLNAAVMPFAKRSSDKDLRETYVHLFKEQKKLNLEDDDEMEKIEGFKKEIHAMISRNARSRTLMPPPKPREGKSEEENTPVPGEYKLASSKETDATRSQDYSEEKEMQVEDVESTQEIENTPGEVGDEKVATRAEEKKSKSTKKTSSKKAPSRRSSRKRR